MPPETYKKPPLFTLATVTLNNASGLENTWKSIESQSYNDFEWLIQDGGSTDNTLELLQKIVCANIQSKPDNGIYNAMNRLIERSSGEYILFLNAGDALAAPETLAIIADTLKNSTPDLIYGDALETSKGLPTHNLISSSSSSLSLIHI